MSLSYSTMVEARNCSHQPANKTSYRTEQAIVAPFARTDIRKYSFAVEHWKSLTERARTANSQHAFKAVLKNIRM